MPRKEEVHIWKQVSFPELVTAIGSGTSFSVSQLVSMLATAENKGEDFRIVHQDQHLVVPLGLVQEYFKDHARPAPKMTLRDEVEYLRKRVAELEVERVGPVEAIKPHPDLPARPEIPEMPAQVPPRDENIPREKMSAEDLRDALKKDLSASKPLSRESKVVRKSRESAAEDKL
jgi:hypothetical protein